jgi:hypothetical protein
MAQYFSEREQGPKPRITSEVTKVAWGGIVALVNSLMSNGAFGNSFPDNCPDGYGVVGTQSYEMGLAIQAEIPGLHWPIDPESIPDVPTVMDLSEFAHAHVAKPIARSYHSFFKHTHLSYEKEEGQREFRERFNRILSRNGLRFQMTEPGIVQRLSPAPLEPLVARAFPPTGDSTLDGLLADAARRFGDPDADVRRDALEKIWDAWERVKSVAHADKKRSVQLVLERAASEPNFRATLDAEARELTRIGNAFRIRHSETSQTAIESDSHVDYLFYRLAAMMWLILESR